MRPWLSVVGHALHAVHAGFVFQPGEHAAAVDLGDALLQAAQLGVGVFQDLEAPAAGFGVALVHARTARWRTGPPRRRRRRGAFPGWRRARPPRPSAAAPGGSRAAGRGSAPSGRAARSPPVRAFPDRRAGSRLRPGRVPRRAGRRRGRPRFDLGEFLRGADIRLAGQALAQHRAQLLGARGDAVEAGRRGSCGPEGTATPPPLEGGGRGRGAYGRDRRRSHPSPHPLPQGEGES